MKGKQVIVGVTGGIAAYKAGELVRLLVRGDAVVRVVMTENATRFVTPVTFEALSGHRVIWDMWDRDAGAMDHIAWGQDADLIIVAPATANIVAKMAHGIADDFLTTMILAATARVLVCPAMNAKMVQNPVLQENLQRLRERGMTVMEPGEGPLACRADGPGRLRDPEDIVEEASVLLSKQDLSGLRFLVTAGATEEPLDPVRYISNRSTGKMGYAVARAARRRGASVVLVSGPTALKAPLGVHLLRARTAEDMRRAVFEHRKGCDVIVKAAAVSDYRPRRTASEKIKKGQENLTLELIRNPDILAELGQTKADSPCILVGFAAETEGLLTHAKEKLEAKHLDMIVANDVSRDDAGFGTDTNVVKMIFRDGRIEDSSLMSKDAVADLVLDRVRELVEATHGGQGRT